MYAIRSYYASLSRTMRNTAIMIDMITPHSELSISRNQLIIIIALTSKFFIILSYLYLVICY